VAGGFREYAMDVGQAVRGVSRNVLLVALLFLPLYLVATRVEILLRGLSPFDAPIGHEVGAFIIDYLSLLLPTVPGAIVHSAALALVPATVSRLPRRLAAALLAPLVPGTVVLLFPPEGQLYSGFVWSTAAATLAYGLTCATQLGRSSNPDRNS
jgi:hypothetical protein